MLIANPVYVSFKSRLKPWVVRYLLFTFVFAMSVWMFDNFLYSISFIAIFIITLSIHAIRRNRFYPKSIKINPDHNIIEIEIYKWNQFFGVKTFSFNDTTKIRVEKVSSSEPIYSLNFYSRQRKIFSIKEGGAWSSAIFILISKYVSDVRGLPFYADAIEVRGDIKKYFPDEHNFSITK